MSSSTLMRWSGLSAVASGGLFIILDILEFVLFGNQSYAEAASSGPWLIVQTGFVAVMVLLALGLVGLYVCQSDRAGALGLIAFPVAFAGAVMAAGAAWSEAFFAGWLAEAAPELLSADPSGAFVTGLVLTFGLFALGGLLFGLATLRAGVLPRGGAALLIIGAVAYPLAGMLELPFASIVFGLAVAWLGFALWSGASEREMVAKAAI